ncbi:MAG: hypothetical protein SNJ59_11265 [Aggregatilineales bacterium]
MSGIYDRLNAEIDDEEPKGITPLDIADLPNEQKQIMLFLLREHSGPDGAVEVETLRTRLKEKVHDFDSALKSLMANGWLIEMGEAPNQRYRVNLRVRRGSEAGIGLWSLLFERISKDA